MGLSSLQEKVLEGQNKSSLLLCCHKIPLPLNILLASPSKFCHFPLLMLRFQFERADQLKWNKTRPPKISIPQAQDLGEQNCNTALNNKLPFPDALGQLSTGNTEGKQLSPPLCALCCLAGTLSVGFNGLWQRF